MEFEQYLRGALRPLLRFAVVLVGDHGTAEDIVQEVATRAFQRWGRIGDLPDPHAYVRRMVVNETVSWHRKWGRISPAPDTALDRAHTDPEVGQYDDLLRRLDSLPPRQRAVVVLRYFEDLSDEEIADTLGCRPVTVRGYAHRALTTLRAGGADGHGDLGTAAAARHVASALPDARATASPAAMPRAAAPDEPKGTRR